MSSIAFGGRTDRWATATPVVVVGSLAAGAALVLGVVPLEVYFGAVGLAIALVIGGLVIAKASQWSGIEYSLILVAAIFVPHSLPGGLSVPLAVALFACVWWLGRQVLKRRVLVDPSPAAMAAWAFVGIALLSFIVGQYPWFPAPGAPMRAQLGGLALFVVSGCLLLAVSQEMRSIDQVRRLTWLFVMLGGVFTIQQAIPPNGLLAIMDRASHPDSVGAMFWVWFVAITFSQALFNHDLSLSTRAGLGVLGTAALYRGLVVAFSWASGWLPSLVAVGVLGIVRFPRLAVASAALAAAPAFIVGGMAVDKVMSGESYSWMTRVEALSVVAQMLKSNPLLGFGPANYYHYTLLFPILGWWVRFNSHNNYIDLVAQTGLIGLAVFGWLALELFLMSVRGYRGARDGFSKAYMMGSIAGLVASLVAAALADWIVPFAYNIGTTGFRSSVLFWFFLGGALAIRRLSLREPTTVEGEPVALRPLTTQPW